jgi:alkanesulfonate monooxygenase SsuD/methylene tetrahydromethanopterin reductase-like flavin-dependent oxidoreductase (luciferase family)
MATSARAPDDTDFRVGVRIPREYLVGNVELVRSLMERVDAAGLDHVCVGDHVSFQGGQGFDGLIYAAVLAAAHPTLAVHVAVYLLPLRHPVLVARQLSTLTSIAPGRIGFGVGIGGEDRHEVEITGVDPATRGARMDESLTALRELLTGKAVTLDGTFFRFDDAVILPAPDPPVPIVVGGRSDAALRRAGRLGDGWLGIWISPDRFARSVETVYEHARAIGRVDFPRHHALHLWCGLDDDPAAARAALASAMESLYQVPYERFERWSPAGRPQDVADFLVPYLHASPRTINLAPASSSVEYAIEAAGEVRRLVTAEMGRPQNR